MTITESVFPKMLVFLTPLYTENSVANLTKIWHGLVCDPTSQTDKRMDRFSTDGFLCTS